MKSRRVCCLIIAAMLMLSAISCSSQSNVNSNSENNSDVNESSMSESLSEEISETTESFDPGLPEKDFGGETFTILTKSVASYGEWGETSIYTEELSGDVLNDAVYNRNAAVEDQFNIKIAQYESSNPSADVTASVMAGDGAYDVVMPPLDAVGGMISNGHLLDLKEIEYINLEKPWWDQRSVEDLSIANKLYMVSGDISTLNNDATWCTMINLEVLNNYGLESPYELVRQNQWTYPKFYELCQNVSQDLDGDSEYTYNDLIANLTQNENATAMLIGAGIHLVDKDSNDIPVYNLPSNERAYSVLETISQIMNDKVCTINYHVGCPEFHLTTTKMFEENRGLFWITNLQMVIRLREMETDFGIAPVPKFDESQENYSNVVWFVGSYTCVPKTTNDLERTGIILEAMAAKSREILRPAYYEVALSYKYLRDTDSIEMLDLVIGNRTYELAQAFGWGISGAVDSIVLNGKEPASSLEKISKLTEIQINSTLEKINAN